MPGRGTPSAADVPDVLVVGAGPAGSIAALMLARNGYRVRLVDRARFPRDKLCGDTLNPGALAILDRLGVSAGVRRRSLPVRGMIVTGPGRARVVGEYAPHLQGAAIRRRDLDLLLLEEAARAGAAVDAGVVVRAPLLSSDGRRVLGVRAAGGETLRARLVIAADGRQSRLAFELGLAQFAPRPRRWAFGAYYAGVDGMTGCGEMHLRSDGYIGVAPLPGGAINVCVVRELSSRFRAHRANAAELFESALAGDSELCERFAGAQRVSEVAVLGPLAVDARAAGMPGLLLAGDAAGFIDPMTGDGMRFAIGGAELAASAALRELATGRPQFAVLAQQRREAFAGKWRVNRALRALAGSPRGLRLAAAVGRRWGGPVRLLIDFAGDLAVARAAGPAGP